MTTKEPKPRQKKTPALTPEEFSKEVETVSNLWHIIANYYSGVNKRKMKTGDNAPSKIEFNSINKMLDGMQKPYAKMSKKPKRKTTPPKNGNTSRGFKQERFFYKAGVSFVNSHGDLDDNLKLEPIAAVGGDAVWNIAQATQLIVSYVERHHLKDPNEKTKITFDGPMTELFEAHMGSIEKKKWSTNADGKFVINHNTLQSLIPKLFDRDVPVPESYLSAPVKQKLLDREVILSLRTVENCAAREKAKKDDKAEKDAAAAAKK